MGGIILLGGRMPFKLISSPILIALKNHAITPRRLSVKSGDSFGKDNGEIYRKVVLPNKKRIVGSHKTTGKEYETDVG